jgi:predicted RNA binding protein YcfA (HicA-like mRNA interferase family)
VAGILPRGLKPYKVIAAFERAGGRARPGKGSHVNVKMPGDQLITIPAHGEVKVGLLRAALRRLGMSVEEFLDLLGR